MVFSDKYTQFDDMNSSVVLSKQYAKIIENNKLVWNVRHYIKTPKQHFLVVNFLSNLEIQSCFIFPNRMLHSIENTKISQKNFFYSLIQLITIMTIWKSSKYKYLSNDYNYDCLTVWKSFKYKYFKYYIYNI
jgi:hypothetical protein